MSNYKRLTTRDSDLVDTICKNCERYNMPSCSEPYACYEAIINRLAELEDKIENKTLMEVPCKVGDKVYMPWQYDGISDIATLTVKRLFVDDKCITTDLISDNFDFYKKYGFGVFMFDEIGTKVFLIKAEAEKKLRELKGEVF